MARESFTQDFKRFFLRGLAAVLPTVLTIAILVYVFRLIHDYIGRYINAGVLWIIGKFWYAFASPRTLEEIAGTEAAIARFQGEWGRYFWWIGFLLAIVGIYIFGRFIGSFFGRGIWRLVEGALLRLPVVKQVFPHVKQVTDFLFSERKIEFSRVVAVEYPRKGVWSLGLVTGPGMRMIHGKVGGEMLTVFIPSSPTPVTGYTITVRRDEVIDLPISFDDALRFTISGGVIMPLSQKLSEAEIEQARRGILPLPESKENRE
jgi:uncharacterized membrane protein